MVWAALLAPWAQTVAIEWVSVEDPGNDCDPQSRGDCFGMVADVYRISRFEITNAQYTEFLNAVAQDDPNSIYAESDWPNSSGPIRAGSPGDYSYSAPYMREDWPINFVSWQNAARFANWLHNGQPTGPQGPGTSEDGAYTITPSGISSNSIARNPDARVFIPSEDEWYKAAYYDAFLGGCFGGYCNYPTNSDTPPSCSTPTLAANTANCNGANDDRVDVGSYPNSPSSNGTFDQGGNLAEWTEEKFGMNRVIRGGRADGFATEMAAEKRFFVDMPFLGHSGVGFRISSVPATIDNLLDSFDTWVSVGSLVGTGGGNSARGRLGALGNMLVTAANLIDVNDIPAACDQLADALARTDGESRPSDFVGDTNAAALLAAEIAALMDSLGCP
jgi:formylglycine-generating enzyme required for sulfatase activity